MSDAELFELMIMTADQIDSSFEYWLTISFGVLIAVHFTRGSLATPVKVIICLMYIAASLLAISLTIGDMIQIVDFGNQLSEQPTASIANAIGSVIRMLLYVAGSACVSIAVFRYDKWISEPEAGGS